MTRIYDDPNHPQYGPIRRLWVILVQLNILDVADRFVTKRGNSWDQHLARLIRMGLDESHAQRMLLSMIIEEAD